MTVDVQSFLDRVGLFYPTILSTLAGYLLAAPWSLRLWIATQKIKPPPIKEDEVKTRSKAKAIGVFLSILTIEYLVIFKASPQVFSIFLSTIFHAVFCYATIMLFADLTGCIKWSVHRNNRGMPIIAIIKQNRNKKQMAALFAMFLASIALTAGAFATNNTVLISLASTALVYIVTRHVGFMSVSMRGMAIVLLGFIAFFFVVFGAAVAAALTVKKSGSSNLGLDFSKSNWTSSWFDEGSWVLAPIYSYIPGILIAFCLRLDYQKYLNTGDSAQEYILTTHPAPEPAKGKASRIGEGFVLPSLASTPFPKVYYATALVACGTSQFGMICIDAFTTFSLENACEFKILAVMLEVPMIFAALLVVAAVRGEWKMMWKYRETWVVKAEVNETPAIQAVSPLSGEADKVESAILV